MEFLRKCALIATALLCTTYARADLFQDVAPSLGLTETGTTFGVSWGDVDGDDRPDLFLGNHSSPAALYINDPVNGFVEFTNFVNLDNTDMHGAAFGDFDNDGDQDLLVTRGAEVGAGFGPNQLFVNDISGAGTMSDMAVQLGLDYPLSRARHVNWLDWNNDGWLDALVVSTNVRPVDPQAPTRMYTFNPVTQAYEEEPWTLHNQSTTTHAQLLLTNPVLANDPALILSHNKNGFPDFIYEYGPAGFSDSTSSFALPGFNGVRDFALGDFDNDGTTDMITVGQSETRVFLQGASGFVESNGTGLTENRAIYTVAADFDNDKDLDIYIARGRIGTSSAELNSYFENDGSGNFTEIANGNGAEGNLVGFVSSATKADFNNDGFIDILVTNSDNWFLPAVSGPIQLFENQGNSNNYLAIKLVGTVSNRDAIGARVLLTSGGTTQLREKNGGIHNRTQDHDQIHFGLGSDSIVNTLEVHWPSGTVQTFSNISPNQLLVVHELDPSQSNSAPTAAFSSQTVEGTLEVSFDSSGSVDPDGIIASYLWDFGDGTTSTERHPNHTYASEGTYNVTLTVTDDLAANDTASEVLSLSPGTTVEAVGSNPTIAFRLIDEQPNGDLDLSTFWVNNGALSEAWITIDLGASLSISQVLVAPRGDRSYVMDISIGDNLTGGKVSDAPIATCSTPGTESGVPNTETVCSVPVTSGRYITVQATNRANFRVHGIRAVEGVIANIAPFGSATAVPSADGLTVAFDATASSDPDGTITTYSWSFGDGGSAAGNTASNTYAPGTYNAVLTLTDNAGDTSTLDVPLTLAASASADPLPATVEAVGAGSPTSGNLIDVLGNGDQNLTTPWENLNAVLDDAWFTLDVGTSTDIDRVDLAPHGGRLQVVDIYVGNSVDAQGYVTSASAQRCNITPYSTNVPQILFTCGINQTTGRYVTVQSINRSRLTMYGALVFPASSGSSNNTAPSASFSTAQQGGSLTIDFDASASTDNEGNVSSYAWKFGDGNSGAGALVSNTYATEGEQRVSLAATDDMGAVHAFTQSVTVTPPPNTPNFVTHPQSQTIEAGESVTFSALATGPDTISYQWRINGTDIAGATSANYSSSSFSVADDGAQLVVVATNSSGSVISNPATLTVLPANIAPTAAFTLDNTSGTAPVTVNADASNSTDSDGTIQSYDWTFGDGSSASGVTANHQYSVDGTFTVTLTVTDDDGATDSATAIVVVNAPSAPTIAQQPQPVSAPAGTNATFSVIASGTPTLTYQWLRDGTPISGATGTSYTLAGVTPADDGANFAVVVNNSGGSVTSNSALLSVNAAPTASFTATPNTGLVTLTVNFDAGASSDVDGTINAYIWDFGDGTSGSGETISHDYISAGIFTITLTVIDDDGATATENQAVVANQAPVASFSIDEVAGSTPHAVSVDATTSSDETGIATYQWDFGDGNFATGVTASNTYLNAGSFTVTLTVTDDNGATDSISQTVTVNASPIATFTLTPDNGTVPFTVAADASTSSDSDGTITSYSWDFGDGASGSGATASHEYLTPGSFTVTLTVTDNDGGTTQATQSVIANAQPVASFTTDVATGLTPLPVTFDATGSADSDGTITDYQWDFGDGGSANGVNANHTYANSGDYTATLTVTDDRGATATATLEISVNDAPIATFSVSPTGGFEPLPISADGSASTDPDGTIASYIWDFGDGSSGNGPTVSHTYTDDGTYTLTLTVTDNAGASATSSQTIVVDPVFPPSFTAHPASQAVPLGANAAFTASVDGTPPFAYQWFRDGNPIAGETASNYVLNNTNIGDEAAEFTLAVTNAAATVTSNSAILTIIVPPNITGQPQAQTVSIGNTAVFSVNATGSAPLSFQWQRDGIDLAGETASSFVVSDAQISDSGQIRVLISNSAGTATSDEAELLVFDPNESPVAQFASVQQGNTRTVVFDGSASSDSDGTISQWSWDFGDGNTDSGAVVTHTYSADGDFTVTLTVTDNESAQTSAVESVQVQAFTILLASGTPANGQVPDSLVDKNPDDSQNLSTSWQNSGSSSTAWYTLDLGATMAVNELRIAPRANRNHNLAITVGDTLIGGIVDAPVTATCSLPNLGFTNPLVLEGCTVPITNGRYVTIESTNVSVFRVFGNEIGVQLGPVNQSPSAILTFAPVADTRTISFDGTSSSDPDGSITSYSWDFGDGNSATGAQPSHSYILNGTYSVTLTVTDDSGATDSTTQDVVVNLATNMLKADVSVEAAGGNGPLQPNLIDQLANTDQNLMTSWNNSGGLVTAWFTLDMENPANVTELHIAVRGNTTFDLDIHTGDTLSGGQVTGGSSTSCTTPNIGSTVPSALYVCPVNSATGRFVTVTSTNRSNYVVHGVEVWVEDTGQNNEPPLSAFNATQQPQTLTVNFDGSASSDSDGVISTWGWDFGDGNSASGETATNTYASAGTYTATLTVTDELGATDSSNQEIVVAPLPEPPTITSQPQNVSVSEGESATFTVLANGDEPLTYQWQRDGSDIAGANAANLTLPTTATTDSGALFTVRVSNSVGFEDSAAAVLTVTPQNQAPSASFTLNSDSGDAPHSINVDASASNDSDGSIADFAWDFGDNTSANGTTASHVYLIAGVYTITLTVTDNDGSTDQATTTVTVNEPPLPPTIETQPQPVSVEVSDPVSFTIVASGTAPLAYQWHRDGNDILGATEATYSLPTAELTDDGAVFSVTVSNAQGSATSADALLTVTEPSLVSRAVIDIAAVGLRPNRIPQLIDTQSNGEQILLTSWNSGSNPVDGWFTIDLGSSQTLVEIRIAPRADRLHELDIRVGDTLVAGEVTGTVTAQCTTPDLGSTATPTELQICTIPPTVGRYATVRATNQNNFRAYGVEAYVNAGPLPNQSPIAALEGSQESGTLQINFDASSSSDADGSITTYDWDFGDGNGLSDGTAMLSHTYATAGTYTATVTVTDNEGATGIASTTLQVTDGTTPVKQTLIPIGAGNRLNVANRAVDELGNGDQDLSTLWNNGGSGLNGAWITFNLGNSVSVSEVRVAPRGNRQFDFEITISDTLVNGQATGGTVVTCSTVSAGGFTPTSLTDCPVPNASGRYVMVRSLNQAAFNLHGVEVYSGGSAGNVNTPPVAGLTAMAVTNTLMANFDASSSNDPDGSLVEFEWDFGDGNSTTTTSATVSHTYAAAGTYTASVTVTDNELATDSATTTVSVSEGGSGNPAKAALTVAATGNGGNGDNAIDELGNTEQNLVTQWNNGSNGIATAWITLDLGASATVSELRIATHGLRSYNLDVAVGDTLSGGKVTDSPVAICSLMSGSSVAPSALTSCAIPATVGRYVTITSRNFANLRVYGTEIYTQ